MQPAAKTYVFVWRSLIIDRNDAVMACSYAYQTFAAFVNNNIGLQQYYFLCIFSYHKSCADLILLAYVCIIVIFTFWTIFQKKWKMSTVHQNTVFLVMYVNKIR